MIRAYIQEQFASDSVDIAIIQSDAAGSPDTPKRILRLASDESRFPFWEPLPEDARNVEPTLRLNNEAALALLDALTRHYQGAEDTRALRRDYDAERKRVDQLTATLGTIASSLASRVVNTSGEPEPVLTEGQWREIAGER